MLRSAAVAGQFYPGSKAKLEHDLASLLADTTPQPAIAVMSPHAGYIYSGGVAAKVFSQVKIPARLSSLARIIMAAAMSPLSMPRGLGDAFGTDGDFRRSGQPDLVRMPNDRGRFCCPSFWNIRSKCNCPFCSFRHPECLHRADLHQPHAAGDALAVG